MFPFYDMVLFLAIFKLLGISKFKMIVKYVVVAAPIWKRCNRVICVIKSDKIVHHYRE